MAEDLFTGKCIRSVSGMQVDIFDPEESMFKVEDIAHGLSNMCRFAGHTCVFYSVAQHAVLCSILARKFSLADSFVMLHHDDSEAYMADIARPIKQKISNYKQVEHILMLKISDTLHFYYPLEPHHKKIDDTILQQEYDQLMIGYHCLSWFEKRIWHGRRFLVNTIYYFFKVDLSFDRIVPFWPSNAKQLFLRRHKKIMA